MAITLPLPSFKDERVFSARSKRLGVPAHEMLRYQGWEGVVVQELQEARQLPDPRLPASRRRRRDVARRSPGVPQGEGGRLP